jgi:hypothetical protein
MWWVPYILAKHKQIVAAVNKWYHKQMHKYGIEISKNYDDCMQIDCENGNTATLARCHSSRDGKGLDCILNTQWWWIHSTNIPADMLSVQAPPIPSAHSTTTGWACAWTNWPSTYVLGKSFQWAMCPLPPYHYGTGPTTGRVQPQ